MALVDKMAPKYDILLAGLRQSNLGLFKWLCVAFLPSTTNERLEDRLPRTVRIAAAVPWPHAHEGGAPCATRPARCHIQGSRLQDWVSCP